jgi:hypothetical protein
MIHLYGRSGRMSSNHAHPVDHAPIVTASGIVLDVIREPIGAALRVEFCRREAGG